MNESKPAADWRIFRGAGPPHDDMGRLPPPPPWRNLQAPREQRGGAFQASEAEVRMVNAALYLRRPLLVTGKPGSGKSSLAYAVAAELNLGRVLRWNINSRSALTQGLYEYDAIARLRDANLDPKSAADIGRYVALGPLGTALLPRRQPRVLLIDEIDKSDIDLPNDLLHVFEEGEYEIPELARAEAERVSVRPHGGDESERVAIVRGRVRCETFPFVLLTSNGERELPPAFYRRCLRLDLKDADEPTLRRIIAAHLEGRPRAGRDEPVIADFMARRDRGTLATDQLLNALYLFGQERIEAMSEAERRDLVDAVLRDLGTV
jgi:MoxR-like ATPase